MKRYTQKQKEEIIEYYHIHGLAKTNKHFGLGGSTVYVWMNPELRKRVIALTKQWRQGPGKERHQYHHDKYHENNPEYDLNHKRKYLRDPENLEQKRVRERIYHKHKMKYDINYRLRKALRNRISSTVIKRGYTKSQRTIKLIGCTIEFLKEHLQRQFQSGMNWNNYGQWHIDHIKPCNSFNLEDPTEQQKCFNYNNLQPLWAVDNYKKHDKII